MSLDPVCRVLRYRGRSDLAALLSHASVSFDESDTYGSFYCSRLTAAEVRAPIQDYDQLRALSQADQDAILGAMLEIWPPGPHEMEIVDVTYRLDPSSLQGDASTQPGLLEDVSRLASLMIDVATGGPRIDSVNREYRERYARVNATLRELGIRDPNPYRDLWEWYGKWSRGDLPTYQSRRGYIRDLMAPLEQQLQDRTARRGAGTPPEPTGWPRVDRVLGEIRTRLEEARAEEQFQAVGLLCREALISLAQTVYDRQKHIPRDGTAPSPTDAKRMLDAYLAAELSGGENEAARRHAKASLDLANALQHQRTATFRRAALCAEATASVINTAAILSGRRDPEPDAT